MTRASPGGSPDLRAIHAALVIDDLDAAIQAGLLVWDGAPGPVADGISFDPGTWARLRATRSARMGADAARARMLARNARLAAARTARAAALLARAPAGVEASAPAHAAPIDSPQPQADLPEAARAALARALARARSTGD